ncbi:MAG: hypothetical protein E7626_03670 [Ruminococcaceae bacterium]|nr:hypothetical protein [Oscillospiraceae bacterium]
MNNGFKKFKRKLFVGALIKSSLFGISTGAFLSALLVLISKLSKKVPNPLIYFSAGIACAVILTSLLFILLRPSDRRVAKKLDGELDLNEKVQTMIAFQNESGDVIEMQRRDTERILDELPAKELKGKRLWIHLIMPVLAAAMLVTALLFPTYKEVPPTLDSDPAFELSAWQEQALKDLIEEVKKSDMEASPRNAVVSELEALLSELRTVKKVSLMKASVIGAIKDINEAVDSHNSYIRISEELSKSNVENVKKLGSAVRTLSAIALGDTFTQIRNTFPTGSDTEKIFSMALEIRSALALSGKSSDDPLYAALDTFAGTLLTAISNDDTVSEKVGSDLDSAFTASGEAVSSAFILQYTNERVGDNATVRLMQIFGISESELPEESRPGNSSTKDDEGDYTPDDDDDDTLHSGGYGSGDMIYGSDDMIYDPELGKYVSYGEVINKYYAKISEQILDGNLSEELEQLLGDYFASLFDGSKADGE